MSFFQKVEGDSAIVVIKGVYKQCDLYTRDGYIYVATAGGFVRLMADGATSKADMRLDFMSWSGELAARMGRLCKPGTPGAVNLPAPATAKLLGAPE